MCVCVCVWGGYAYKLGRNKRLTPYNVKRHDQHRLHLSPFLTNSVFMQVSGLTIEVALSTHYMHCTHICLLMCTVFCPQWLATSSQYYYLNVYIHLTQYHQQHFIYNHLVVRTDPCVLCGENAECVESTIEGETVFECVCEQGYQGDGFECESKYQ